MTFGKSLIPALATLLAATTTSDAENMPKTEFNVVGSIGILSMYKDMEVPFWTETIPDASGGAVTVQIKPFNELGFKGGELFNLVSQGTVPVAHQVLAYTSGAVPANEAADLVGVVKSVDELQAVANAYRDHQAAYLAKDYNIKLLGYGTYQAQVIYCRDAFTTLADLKGRKVRASGASQQVFISHLGGSPIGMAVGEVQTALANGVVDCAITGALSGYLAKWHESAKFISPMPVNYGLIAVIANQDWWNGLDPKVQTLIESQMAALEEKMFALAATETADGLACNSTGPCAYGEPAGMTLVPLAEGDAAIRDEAVTAAVLPAYKDRCGADCATKWNETIGKVQGATIQ
ncbi:MAG: TRAP transporter substrate-binding protein [Sneathiellaceae bacterium]